MQGALNANKAIFFLIRWLLLRVLCAYPGDLEGPCSCVRRKRDRQASRLHSFIKYEAYNSSRRATETGGGKSGVPCFATPTTGCCRSIQCKYGLVGALVLVLLGARVQGHERRSGVVAQLGEILDMRPVLPDTDKESVGSIPEAWGTILRWHARHASTVRTCLNRRRKAAPPGRQGEG